MALKHNLVCVDGVIGVGKTILALKLAAEWGTITLLEEALENPYLDRFYDDPETFAFPAQLHFLMARFKELSRLKQTSLFERTVVADYTIYKDWVFASINLPDNDFKIYEKMYADMVGKVPEPDLVILLQAKVDTLMRRIAKRGRDLEKGIAREYIESLVEAYNSFFFTYYNGPLLVVNTDNLNPSDNPDHLQRLLSEIDATGQARRFLG
ncbi:deoxynucleoside kinase [candidate division WOR-3 bacterium]|nr:deoxynucleoside kinase [candidate division WOR-3 bacterium]